MQVPTFWAEARRQKRTEGRSVTVRRFGWSDLSQEDAQANADARAEEALERIWAGEKLPRRNRKIAYNGAEGLPIREEIVERVGTSIITRNSYGARCLNTPDVLFADIDFPAGPSCGLSCGILAAALITGIVAAIVGKAASYIGLGLLAGLLLLPVVNWAFALRGRILGGWETWALGRVRRFARRHPSWRVNVYRTPSGMRVLALHRTFDPTEKETAQCFDALGVDRLYRRMCVNQRCFRARVSPKPWRIGISRHLRPRPGVWPINPERLPDRQRWIEDYEMKSLGFASCRFIETLGSKNQEVSEARLVRELHDHLCRVESGLPLA